jgi:hypothetical protein
MVALLQVVGRTVRIISVLSTIFMIKLAFTYNTCICNIITVLRTACCHEKAWQSTQRHEKMGH